MKKGLNLTPSEYMRRFKETNAGKEQSLVQVSRILMNKKAGRAKGKNNETNAMD